MESEKYDVLVLGLGAVGSLYAYVLEKSMRCRVTALARSLYEPINFQGLTIKSKKYGEIPNWKPYRVIQSVQEANDRPYRFIINCVKCLPDVEPSPTLLEHFLKPPHEISDVPSRPDLATLVLIQNGIGIEQPLAEAFPSVHIISCVAWVCANIKKSSSASHRAISPFNGETAPVTLVHGALDQLAIGLYEGEGFVHSNSNERHGYELGPCNGFVEGLLANDGRPLEREAREERLIRGQAEAQLFADIIRAGGGNATVEKYIQPKRWAKAFLNGTTSTMCALSRAAVATLVCPQILPHTLPVVRQTMLEIMHVARALGYRESELPVETIEESIQLALQAHQTKPSSSTTLPSLDRAFESVGTELARTQTARKCNDTQTHECDHSVGPEAFKPSMLIDLENDAPMELEPIIGGILTRARSKSIETPRLELLYSLLKILQEQAITSRATKLRIQGKDKQPQSQGMVLIKTLVREEERRCPRLCNSVHASESTMVRP
ncbi:hypothetical protein O181_028697 [Austropuccinia psidii MF-1]|uniref:Ketopantoate reductase C-terminal domain-containing protein n=1 Tax=Austropuccinia psidii MF-1 TaxID=1389203 RepID=A0A9Q3H2U6_9BASI|nr:hypothetical protein [Austropuccinia psidii MF-1]